MNKNLLIIGAGQCGNVAKEIAEAMGCFEKIDFLDDTNEIAIGKFCDYEKYTASYTYAIVAVGNANMRLEWINKLESACYKIATLVHPKAYVAPSAQIMKGSIVEPMSAVHTGCVIAVGCIISAGAVINHASMCCDAVHIDCNATVAGNSLVPAGTHVHCGEVFKRSEFTPHGPLPVDGREYCFEDGM